MNIRRSFAAPALLTFAALLTMGGCVNQDAYDDARRANEALKAQNQELLDRNAQLEEANRRNTAAAGESEAARQKMATALNELQAQLAQRDRQLAEFDSRFGQIQVGTLLDPQTDAALKDLASRYPQLLSYDADRGMVRFNSDITFASGSWDLTSQARQAIGEFARLLREIPSAHQYDLKVIGHTDTQRVTQRPGRRITNNDELSAFRAISVKNEFVSGGIANEKIEFAGFGEVRPVIDRGPNANVPENRRVEVFLVKSTFTGAVKAPAPAVKATPAPKPATPRDTDIMK